MIDCESERGGDGIGFLFVFVSENMGYILLIWLFVSQEKCSAFQWCCIDMSTVIMKTAEHEVRGEAPSKAKCTELFC